MADGYDRFENEGGGGGSFVMGLLTGTVLGAGLGMLFAPKSGSELRNQLSEQAGNPANTASHGHPRATEAAGDSAHRARAACQTARHAARRGRAGDSCCARRACGWAPACPCISPVRFARRGWSRRERPDIMAP